VVDSPPDGGDGTGDLVTQDRREREGDRTVLDMQVGVADPASGYTDQDLPWARFGIAELLDGERC